RRRWPSGRQPLPPPRLTAPSSSPRRSIARSAPSRPDRSELILGVQAHRAIGRSGPNAANPLEMPAHHKLSTTPEGDGAASDRSRRLDVRNLNSRNRHILLIAVRSGEFPRLIIKTSGQGKNCEWLHGGNVRRFALG